MLEKEIIIVANHPGNEYLKIKIFEENTLKPGIMKFWDSFYDENGELL